MTEKEEHQRTTQQNKSLHKFYTNLAHTLNEAGLDQRKVLKPSIDIPWTPESIKEQLWRPIQMAQVNKVSTTELSTKEVNEIYNTLHRHLASKFGINESFPSLESLMLRDLTK